MLARSSPWRLLIGNLCLAVAYFAAGKLSLLAAILPGSITPVWLPAGLALAVTLLYGAGYTPGIFTGGVWLACANGMPLLTAIGPALGNTLEPLATAWLFTHLRAFDQKLIRVRDVLALFICATFGTVISATFGIAAHLHLTPQLGGYSASTLWLIWATSNLLGVMALTPIVLLWTQLRPMRLTVAAWLELGTLFLLLIGTSTILFFTWQINGYRYQPIAYIILGFLIWTAVRFNLRITTAAILSISCFALLGTAYHRGPFVGHSAADSLFQLQAFLVVITLIGYLLSTALAQLRRTLLVLEQHEAEYRATFERAPIGIAQVSLDGRFLKANPKLAQILGYAPDELFNLRFQALTHPEDRESDATYRQQLLQGECSGYSVENRFLHKNGQPVWVRVTGTLLRTAAGAPDRFIRVLEDITERKEAEAQLAFLAKNDALTGLANRAHFTERLQQAVAMAAAQGTVLALLYLDLDKFKEINDSLGHAAGDHVLVMAAHRLRESVRNKDMVSRLGGDEFTVILEDIGSAENAATVAAKISEAFARAFELNGMPLYVTSSIGIALFPALANGAGDLLKKADIAMYKAKNLGPNQHQFFEMEQDGPKLAALTRHIA